MSNAGGTSSAAQPASSGRRQKAAASASGSETSVEIASASVPASSSSTASSSSSLYRSPTRDPHSVSQRRSLPTTAAAGGRPPPNAAPAQSPIASPRSPRSNSAIVASDPVIPSWTRLSPHRSASPTTADTSRRTPRQGQLPPQAVTILSSLTAECPSPAPALAFHVAAVCPYSFRSGLDAAGSVEPALESIAIPQAFIFGGERRRSSFAGTTSSSSLSNDLYRYDPFSNQWHRILLLPVSAPSSASPSVSTGTASLTLQSVLWPTPRKGHAMVALQPAPTTAGASSSSELAAPKAEDDQDGDAFPEPPSTAPLLFLFGGETDSPAGRNCVGDLWMYNVNSASWELLTPEPNVISVAGYCYRGGPMPRRGHGMVALRLPGGSHKLVIFGGQDPFFGRFFSELNFYDVQTRAWSVLSPPHTGSSLQGGSVSAWPTPREGHVMLPLENGYEFVLFGGLYRGLPLQDCWIFSAVTWKWMRQSAPLYPSRRTFAAACVTDELLPRIMLSGGIGAASSSSQTGAAMSSPLRSVSPSAAAAGIFPRASTVSPVLAPKQSGSGGSSLMPVSASLADIWQFEPRTRRWMCIGNSNGHSTSASNAGSGHSVHIQGSYSASNSMHGGGSGRPTSVGARHGHVLFSVGQQLFCHGGIAAQRGNHISHDVFITRTATSSSAASLHLQQQQQRLVPVSPAAAVAAAAPTGARASSDHASPGSSPRNASPVLLLQGGKDLPMSRASRDRSPRSGPVHAQRRSSPAARPQRPASSPATEPAGASVSPSSPSLSPSPSPVPAAMSAGILSNSYFRQSMAVWSDLRSHQLRLESRVQSMADAMQQRQGRSQKEASGKLKRLEDSLAELEQRLCSAVSARQQERDASTKQILDLTLRMNDVCDQFSKLASATAPAPGPAPAPAAGGDVCGPISADGEQHLMETRIAECRQSLLELLETHQKAMEETLRKQHADQRDVMEQVRKDTEQRLGQIANQVEGHVAQETSFRARTNEAFEAMLVRIDDLRREMLQSQEAQVGEVAELRQRLEQQEKRQDAADKTVFGLQEKMDARMSELQAKEIEMSAMLQEWRLYLQEQRRQHSQDSV